MSKPVLSKALKVALLQFTVTADKSKNLTLVSKLATEAAGNGAKLLVLPECFNSPYAVSAFPKYAEPVPGGETYSFLSKLAADLKVFVIGGSIPEKVKKTTADIEKQNQPGNKDPEEKKNDDFKYYNTNLSFSPSGELIGKHRKVHLFDIDVPNKIRFVESDILAPGEHATNFELDGYGRVGLGICYDIRFPELAAISTRGGNGVNPSFAMIYPGAFNTTTGPLHWHLLARTRAVDQQCYVILCSPARDLTSGYHAYGHSLVVDPWGKIVAEAGEGDEIVYANLEEEYISSVKESIPVSTQRQYGIYRNLTTDGVVTNGLD